MELNLIIGFHIRFKVEGEGHLHTEMEVLMHNLVELLNMNMKLPQKASNLQISRFQQRKAKTGTSLAKKEGSDQLCCPFLTHSFLL